VNITSKCDSQTHSTMDVSGGRSHHGSHRVHGLFKSRTSFKISFLTSDCKEMFTKALPMPGKGILNACFILLGDSGPQPPHRLAALQRALAPRRLWEKWMLYRTFWSNLRGHTLPHQTPAAQHSEALQRENQCILEAERDKTHHSTGTESPVIGNQCSPH
jgi:hypothetical protein